MSASLDLTDSTEVGRYLEVASGDDDLIDDLIEAASAAIENYCDRKFKTEEGTEYYDGGKAEVLVLRRYPVDRSADFTIYDDLSVPRDYAAGDALDTDDYTIDYDGGMVFREGGTFSAGTESIKVVYTAGIGAATANLPEDLRMAAVRLVAFFYNQAKEGADGIAAERLTPYQATYPREQVMTIDATVWPARIKMILDAYKDTRVA